MVAGDGRCGFAAAIEGGVRQEGTFEPWHAGEGRLGPSAKPLTALRGAGAAAPASILEARPGPSEHRRETEDRAERGTTDQQKNAVLKPGVREAERREPPATRKVPSSFDLRHDVGAFRPFEIVRTR